MREFLVPAKTSTSQWTREKYKILEEDKLKVNLKYPIYHTLLQIVYIVDIYNIYKYLKAKNKKYLEWIYWLNEIKKYKNTKFLYGWYLTEK